MGSAEMGQNACYCQGQLGEWPFRLDCVPSAETSPFPCGQPPSPSDGAAPANEACKEAPWALRPSPQSSHGGDGTRTSLSTCYCQALLCAHCGIPHVTLRQDQGTDCFIIPVFNRFYQGVIDMLFVNSVTVRRCMSFDKQRNGKLVHPSRSHPGLYPPRQHNLLYISEGDFAASAVCTSGSGTRCVLSSVCLSVLWLGSTILRSIRMVVWYPACWFLSQSPVTPDGCSARCHAVIC